MIRFHPLYLERSLTLDEAFAILRGVVWSSPGEFSVEERSALVTVGAAWKLGRLTPEQEREFMSFGKQS